MTCQTCKHLKSGNLTRQGFSLCALGTNYEHWPLTHTCPQHTQAAPDVLEKRVAWLESKGARK